ncbi:MAG: non-canonical purine NTP pyrophosphatase, partial [Exiguobacterium sp.]
NGFGYDPLFIVPSLHKTAAELEREEKAVVSHRGQALRKLEAEIIPFMKG